MSEMGKKVIWIIGGSGGIGSNLAERMSDEGWNVVISARTVSYTHLTLPTTPYV